MVGAEGSTNDLPDTVAVTKGTDLELLPPSPTSPRHIPNEVLLMIFKLLDKNHLKSVRCACKSFEPLASSLLFDKIYISPHRENLDVFRQITEHPDLCQYPRELVYDVQRFKPRIESREYYETLCLQLRTAICITGFPLHHVGKDIEAFLLMVSGDTPDERESYSTYRVFQQGLKIYREKAEEEEHYNNSGQLLACLCSGLMKLPYLDGVEFQFEWDSGDLWAVKKSIYSRDMRIFSSPLARTWSPFHLQPKAPYRATAAKEFDNVISAFSRTKRPLRMLTVRRAGVPCAMFYTNSSLSCTFRQHGQAVLYRLERLELEVHFQQYSAKEGLSNPEHELPEKKTLSVDLLAAALLHMPRLKILSLSRTADDENYGLTYENRGQMSFSELFLTVRLPALVELTLNSMLGSAADILSFLGAQPRLRKLSLYDMELSEGTWASLVDDMRSCLLLETLRMHLPLLEGGRMISWDKDSGDADSGEEDSGEEDSGDEYSGEEDSGEEDSEDEYSGVLSPEDKAEWEAEDLWREEKMAQRIERYVLHGGEKNPLRVPE